MARAWYALCLTLLSGCGLPAPTPPVDPLGPTRPFNLGLADFPHALSVDALPFAYAAIARDADMAVLQWDDGVPWPEALAGAPYPRTLQVEIDRRVAGTPPGHVIYVAVNAISFVRNGLALYKGDLTNQRLPPGWEGRTFDDPDVMQAFFNHCERMIAATHPRYFAYAIEANMLHYFDAAEWPAFLRLAAALYPRLKERHPGLVVLVTLQADTFHTGGLGQAGAVRDVLPFTDAVVVTAYPFNDEHDPTRLRPDYFSALRDLAPSKPFGVSETCWPAESVTAPYPAPIPATEETQRLYLERLLADADRLHAGFVTWFFTRDYDGLWDDQLSRDPNTSFLRLWKDCGLYTGDARARPSLALWREWLARRRTG